MFGCLSQIQGLRILWTHSKSLHSWHHGLQDWFQQQRGRENSDPNPTNRCPQRFPWSARRWQGVPPGLKCSGWHGSDGCARYSVVLLLVHTLNWSEHIHKIVFCCCDILPLAHQLKPFLLIQLATTSPRQVLENQRGTQRIKLLQLKQLLRQTSVSHWWWVAGCYMSVHVSVKNHHAATKLLQQTERDRCWARKQEKTAWTKSFKRCRIMS